ncbi:MAG: AMP-binding protein [Pseudomonadota bacterium]|nr:AMP-binding protein [Pseudomonadota bacterium]
MDAGPGPHAPDAGQAASQLVDLVRELLDEAHAGRHRVTEATLDSSLDKDLGLDSLARVELLTRVERTFSVEMPGDALGTAETLRDLLRALLAAGPRIGARRRVAADEHRDGVLPVPEGASTLTETLSWHVEAHPERRHALFYRTADETRTLTYGELWRGASAVAAGLVERGLVPGQAVTIMLPSGFEFFFAFFGSLLAGGVPVPLYPPARLSQIEDHLKRQAGILCNSLAPILITVPEATLAARLLKGHAPELREIATVGELQAARPNALRPRIKADDVAFLQYTSGSTGNPKGVVLTHANLLANLRAWGRAARFDSNDVAVSWLPLYHDLGLIGAWLGSLYNGGLLVLMSPLDFLARPDRWLWAIHAHRGTASAAPNFAFELCLRRIEDRDIEGLDLGSWRLAANGAEPVIPDTLRRFTERFAPYGFRAEAMAPVFGLAECTVGLAIPPMGRKPIVDRIERAPFIERRLAAPARAGDQQALEFVACGRVLPGHEMRIVDHEDRELPERSVGHLQFHGPSATRGYFRNPEETARLIHGEWLDSGDFGYIADGDLYVTGRVKDTIIRGGRNILPHALEEAIGGLPGIRKGCVAVFGVPDPGGGTERLVVVAETREGEPSVLEGLRQRINALAVELLETPVDEAVLAPPQSVLKTSSGKIRRAATRELYQRGKLGRTAGAPWLQIARLALSGAPGQLARLARATAAYLYAAYAWIAFALVALIDWVTVLITPSLKWRWQATRGLIRLLLRLVALPVQTEGIERLSVNEPRVFVANHTSFLDVLVLIAMLPGPLHFVAKREFLRMPVLRILFSRLGAQFVERFDARAGTEDTERLKQVARGGGSLMVFAEGTFRRGAGLRPFRMGAFAIAASVRRPVVPVALRGARSVLPQDSWLPRRHPITVAVGEPIWPEGEGWDAAVALRDAAREQILRRCGEPDLG